MSNIIQTAIKALEEKLQDKSIDFSAKNLKLKMKDP